MLQAQVNSTFPKLLNIGLQTIKQPVRTVRTRSLGLNKCLVVKEKDESHLTPPPGVGQYVYNRNPRNLERLAIANKGHGWSLDKPGKTYWHKLIVSESKLGVKVSCVHQTGQVVMSAASYEWCIRKFIPKLSDKCAYTNLGRIFAERCLRCGLSEMFSSYKADSEGKLALLLKEIEDGGVTLSEPIQMVIENPYTKVKPTRPWDVIVE